MQYILARIWGTLSYVCKQTITSLRKICAFYLELDFDKNFTALDIWSA